MMLAAAAEEEYRRATGIRTWRC